MKFVSKPLKEAILRQATTPELEVGIKEGLNYERYGKKTYCVGRACLEAKESFRRIKMEAFTYQEYQAENMLRVILRQLIDEFTFIKRKKIIITNIIKSKKRLKEEKKRVIPFW